MKFKQAIRVTGDKAAQVLALAGLGMSQAFAQGLPTMDAPSQGSGGGLMSTLQGYIYDGAILIGLVLCVIAFFVVASSCVASFKEARERETWGKFAVTVMVGVLLVVAVIWLATEAAPILSQ
jgi:integrating conjugative element membrane protein (TIGR03745 family)